MTDSQLSLSKSSPTTSSLDLSKSSLPATTSSSSTSGSTSATKVANSRPNSPEETDPDQASLGLSSTYRACRDVLEPSVRSGNLAEVRAVLKSLATGGGLEEAKDAVARCGDTSQAGPGEEASAVEFLESLDAEQCEILKECVNFVCPSTGRTLLSVAVEAKDVSVVEELLKHGADPNKPNSVRENLYLLPLEQAAIQQNIEMAKVLMSAGAIVTMAVWNGYWRVTGMCTHLRIVPWIRLLSHEFTQLTPMYYAAKLWILVLGGRLEESDVLPIVGNLSWHFQPGTVVLGETIWVLLYYPRSRSLLHTPVRNEVELFRKSFFLQGVLVNICCNRYEVVDVEQLLSILLREGASFHGWTYSHAVAVQKAKWFLDWQCDVADEQLLAERGDVDTESQTLSGYYAMNRRSSWWCDSYRYFPDVVACNGCQDFWNRGLGLSCCTPEGVNRRAFATMALCRLPAVLACSTECPSAVAVKQASQRAIDAGLWTSLGLSSISSTADSHSRLSFFYINHLCHLCIPINLDCGTETPAKKRPRSYTCSECVIQPLTSLCHDTILSACLQRSANIFFAVQQLPLPPMLKSFLLTC